MHIPGAEHSSASWRSAYEGEGVRLVEGLSRKWRTVGLAAMLKNGVYLQLCTYILDAFRAHHEKPHPDCTSDKLFSAGAHYVK